MYLKWQEKTITDFSDANINDLYNRGFLFTREEKGAMYETRSVRVDLSKFILSSENRRILRKTEGLEMKVAPIPYADYSWEIGKMGKDFYETKFGAGVFSANKIKELMTDGEKSNFNRLLVYCHSERSEESLSIRQLDKDSSTPLRSAQNDSKVGYTICLETNELIHYCYPFYSLTPNTSNLIPNIGISMMTRAVVWAQEHDKKYIYLGSAKDAKALYKFQFEGVEWWDGKKWNTDMEELKNILK
ncbi:MAG: hypothetical protein WCT40_04050 [Candidatus Magasanikbacteria bacterium]|jgi:arginyl-tRNA--protein-N-Asp/Glu arginylyltransferase